MDSKTCVLNANRVSFVYKKSPYSLKVPYTPDDRIQLAKIFENCNDQKINDYFIQNNSMPFITQFQKFTDFLQHLNPTEQLDFQLSYSMFFDSADPSSLLFNYEKRQILSEEFKQYEYKFERQIIHYHFAIKFTDYNEIQTSQIFGFIQHKLREHFDRLKDELELLTSKESFYHLFAFIYLFNLEDNEILRFYILLKNHQIPDYVLNKFSISKLQDAYQPIFFNRKRLLSILQQNVESYLIDIAINMAKYRLDYKITFVENKHRCYCCGHNFGVIFCANKRKYLHLNPEYKCSYCNENLFENKKGCIHDFVKLPQQKSFLCKCENKSIEYIDGSSYKQDNKTKHYIDEHKPTFQEICDKCKVPREHISIIDNESDLKAWIKYLGKITRNVYTQIQIILIFALPGIFLNPNNKLSIFNDFNEYINMTIASNTFFLVWNIITLVITTVISFYYIAREYKESEFFNIKFNDRSFDISSCMKLKYKCSNTILCCAPDRYSTKYLEIAKKILQIKSKSQSVIAPAERREIKELLLKKKELNKDKLISRVLTFLAVLSLPTLVYIIYVMIDEKVFTFVGFLFIVGKIRAAWKIIKIIDILSRVNTCCSWENEKTLKEKDDDKIITNTTEPQFE